MEKFGNRMVQASKLVLLARQVWQVVRKQSSKLASKVGFDDSVVIQCNLSMTGL